MFTVTELLPKPYMESTQDLKFVAEIPGNNETPRKDDTLIIGGISYTVNSIERNYDTDSVFVYVVKIEKYDADDFMNGF